ncbi:MAG: hypothetical protein QGG71_26490 [Pirellulaceae bacterium]|jgi:hypothetical protein|nr:hypothetical protein [Pirellulaceae bacterium]
MPSTAANEFICAIDYRAHAKVMDHRGEWAEMLSTIMGLDHFMIVRNGIHVVDKVEDKESLIRTVLGFKRLSISVRDVARPEDFQQLTSAATRNC